MKAAGSLTLRLALLVALWVAAGLAVAGWFVTGIAGRQIEAAAEARLAALMDAVVAAAATDAAGRPRLERSPPGAEFDRPLSGEYWQVEGPGGTATSRSLWDSHLPSSGPEEPRGPRGERLRLLRRVVEIPGAAGPLVVRVAVSRDATDAEMARLRRGLGLAFGLLGLGLVAGVSGLVVWGLRPLRAARRALAEVRSGARERLALRTPAEIAPLAEEVDALIAQNRETVERARTHAGNLAHALKTPIAVLLNALDQPEPQAALARAQARELERIVQHHLDRKSVV